MLTCQGALLKRAGQTSLAMCATGTSRTHLEGRCRLYTKHQGGLTCVICSCGAVYIWGTGGALPAPSSFSTSWTEFSANDMSAARKGVWLSVSLPSSRDMTTDLNTSTLQQIHLVDTRADAYQEAHQVQSRLLNIRLDGEKLLSSMAGKTAQPD